MAINSNEVRFMSKKQKIVFISVCAAILLIVAGVFLGLHITKINLTNAAVDYLCDKYNATEDEFELIDYERSKYFLNDDAIPQLEKGYYKWEFKYNDRNFFVNLIDGKYYDDYQLEDVEKWCVEWLQENIDKSVYVVEISAFDLYQYQQTIENNSFLFSKDTILDFFHSYGEKTVYDLDVLFVLYNNSNVNIDSINEQKTLLELDGLSFDYNQNQNTVITNIINEMCLYRSIDIFSDYYKDTDIIVEDYK